ncbi:choline uptake/conversion transcriptional regulator CudC [Effusibacillus consociatus]|uniref:HTH-type transcriptional regulator n=1 Tax=Effusibacillus consociatus TaxID=1117041 RepID=A0ABV9PZL5_9BACL
MLNFQSNYSSEAMKPKEQLNHKELLEEAEHIVIDAISETMDLYGVTPSVGRLYGVLYFSDQPMSLDEMSKQMGMSKPSMSTGVHSLMEIFMIQKVWQKGVRKDLYEAEKDFFKSFIAFFCKKWDREILVNLEAINRSENILINLVNDPDTPQTIHQKAQIDLDQLEESKKYYDWLKKLVDAFRSGEIFRLIDGLPEGD